MATPANAPLCPCAHLCHGRLLHPPWPPRSLLLLLPAEPPCAVLSGRTPPPPITILAARHLKHNAQQSDLTLDDLGALSPFSIVVVLHRQQPPRCCLNNHQITNITTRSSHKPMHNTPCSPPRVLDESCFAAWAHDVPERGFSNLEKENTPPCTVASKREHPYQFWKSRIKKPMILLGPSLGVVVAIDVEVNHSEVVKLVLIDASVYAEGTGSISTLPRDVAYAGKSLL